MMDQYQEFIAKSRYARWLDDKGRREDWPETVDRYVDFMCDHPAIKDAVDNTLKLKVRDSILNLEAMPSMRALMTAGPALERCNVAGYNCCYVPVDHQRAFDESMYILMCGTGVGYTVEHEDVNRLPVVAETLTDSDTVIVVADSKIGWAKALRELISCLYSGSIPKWDTSKVRPAGARLKTFGGRASGPAPLEELFRFVVKTFRSAAGRKLYPLECSDLMCKIGEVVVVGGVRRSALICLSDLNDPYMQKAKSGNFGDTNPQRYLANISAVYTHKPTVEVFMKEWMALIESKSGERGVFNRQACDKVVARNGRRETGHKWGTNPCSEIILRPNQFCNLTEVVVRPNDDFDTLAHKVRMATLMGTMQAALTDFKYLRPVWRKNTEEERLLGVSMTGIFEHEDLCNDTYETAEMLRDLRDIAVETNKVWAERFGINQATAVTCVKPSGTVSQLVDCTSGIHPAWSKHYVRNVRADNKDPMTEYLKSKGVPHAPATSNPDDVTVFSFPKTSSGWPKDELDAIEHLEIWKMYAENWCEHKPSVTVYVKKDEWLEVGAWLYKNFDLASGIAFLPADESEVVYDQLPYETCDEETYTKLLAAMPDLDWHEMKSFEVDGSGVNSKELACSAGVCEVVDIVAAA